MKDYIEETESSLEGLSRTLSSHIKQLDSILSKGTNKKLRQPKALKQLKAPASLSINSLFSSVLKGAETSFIKQGISSFNISNESSGQNMADLAAAINRSMSRDL